MKPFFIFRYLRRARFTIAGVAFASGATVLAIPFAVVLMITITSCSALVGWLEGTETVRIILPPEHPVLALVAHEVQPSYTIRWYDREGAAHEKRGIRSDADIALDAGNFTPILVIPETVGTGIPEGALPPAGAVYPVHAETDFGDTELRTNYIRGIDAVCAELACTGARGGFSDGQLISSRFNWRRLDSVIAEKGHPCLVDRSRLADAILSGKVSVYDIAETKVAPIAIEPASIPEGMVFLPPWPEEKGFIRSGNEPFAVDAPPGISRWFSASGIFTLQVKNGRAVCAFFAPYVLKD